MTVNDKHDITKYYKVELNEIKSDRPLPCDIFLFLKINKRVILLRRKGTALEQKRYASLENTNFDQIYIRDEDIEVFKNFKWGEETTPVEPVDALEEEVTVVSGKYDDGEDAVTLIKGTPEDRKEEIQVVKGKFEESKDEFKSQYILHDDKDSVNISEDSAKEILAAIREDLREKMEESLQFISGKFEEKDTHLVKGSTETIGDEAAVIKGGHFEDEDVQRVKGGSSFNPGELLKALDTGIRKHSLSVSRYAIAFARALGYRQKEYLEKIAMACLMHDLGLAEIPSSLRKKNLNSLTPDERNIYESHPISSVEILSGYDEIDDTVKKIILQHHENFDGSGFPEGLKGTKIFEPARILAIANELDRFINRYKLKDTDIVPALMGLQKANRMSSICKLDPVLLSKIISSLQPPHKLMQQLKKSTAREENPDKNPQL